MPPRKRQNKHLANLEEIRNKKPKIDANDVDPRSFIK